MSRENYSPRLGPLVADDWPDVRRVHRAGRLQELSRCGLPAPAFAELDRDRVLASPGVVARLDGRVAGFATWWTDGWISLLYVDPLAQRRGVGRALLDAAMAAIGPQAWTTCVAFNDAALRMYRAAGMDVVWSRPREVGSVAYDSPRLALPTSRMRDPDARRFPESTT